MSRAKRLVDGLVVTRGARYEKTFIRKTAAGSLGTPVDIASDAYVFHAREPNGGSSFLPSGYFTTAMANLSPSSDGKSFLDLTEAETLTFKPTSGTPEETWPEIIIIRTTGGKDYPYVVGVLQIEENPAEDPAS